MAAKARLDLGQGHRCAVGGKDDAFPVLDQGGQGREQLFLGRRLAADELNVVQQKHIGRAQALLEGGGRAVLHRLDEGRQEAFGGQIDDLGLGPQTLGFPGDGVEQVGLAIAIGAAEEDRVEMAVGPAGHLFGDGQGEGVALALDEAVEGQAILQTGGAHGAGAIRADVGRADRRALGRRGEGGQARGGVHHIAGHDGRGGRGGADFGAATHLKTARQAVQAQPQLVHAAQGVLSHPVAGIGGGGDQDQMAGVVQPNGRGRNVGREGAVADFGAQTHRCLAPDAVRIRQSRRIRSARHRRCAPNHLRRRPLENQSDLPRFRAMVQGRLLLRRKAMLFGRGRAPGQTSPANAKPSPAPSSSVSRWKCVRGQNLRCEPGGSTLIRWSIRS